MTQFSSSCQHCRQAHGEPAEGLEGFCLLSFTNTKPWFTIPQRQETEASGHWTLQVKALSRS